MNTFVVGLCGAHGTGKSTILQAVKQGGHSVNESQLSRAAQAALGWDSLSKAQESEENMWALQDAILDAMYDRDKAINESGKLTLVDRTPADVWGYVMLWISRLGEENVNMQRAGQYKRKCRAMAANYRRHLIVPIREEIPFVAQDNRADEASRLFHAKEVDNFVIDGGLAYAVIQSLHIDYRVIEVAERLKTCGGCA